MSFSTNLFTEKGRALQSKVLAGAALNFTRIGMGSGSLGGQSQIALNNLIDQKVSLNVTQVSKSGNYAVVEGNFRNADISTGFYWRELGIFAQDPDIGEILYCYGNAGSLAEYIPPQSSEIIEKVVSLSIIVGDTANVTLLTDSTAFATKTEVKAAKDKADQAFTQASNGKEAIKAAITGIDPTITIPTDATFQQLADCIEEIETDPYADKETKTGKSVQFTDADDAQIAITAMGGTGSVTVVTCRKNHFNKSEAYTHDKALASATGAESANANCDISPYIKVMPSTAYSLTLGSWSATRVLCFYDINKNFISGIAGTSVYNFTTPNNVHYVRFNFSDTIIDNVQLEHGASTPVESYIGDQITITDVTTAAYPLYLTSYKGITNVFTLSTGQPTFTAVAKSELWSGRKKVIPDAVNKKDNRVNIPTDATFAQLATAISQIETGVDTEDATATAEGILSNLTAYIKGVKVTGTIPIKTGVENSATYRKSSTAGKFYLKPSKGYYDGNAEVTYTDAKLISDNIRANNTVLGVQGKSTVVDTEDAVLDPAYLVEGYSGYDDGVKKAGTLPYRIGDGNGYTNINAIASSVWSSSGRLHLPIFPGAYLRNGDAQNYPMIYLDSPDFIEANILSGKNVFGKIGTAIAGKRFASGSVFSGQTQYVFYSRAGGNASWYGLTVSGLTFKPSVIICMWQNNQQGTSYAGDCYTIYSPISGYAIMFTALNSSGLENVNSYQVNVADCYVNASGFRLPALPNVTYNWMAWE